MADTARGTVMKRVMIGAVLFLSSALAGCESLEPNYPTAEIEFDESLLGAWKGVDDTPDAKGTLIVTERSMDERDGRLNPAPWPLGQSPASGRLRSYAARVDVNGRSELEFGGYLVRVGEDRYIGFQETGMNGRVGGSPPLSIPVHWFVRLRHTPDGTYEVDLPREMVGWVPLVHWLDESRDVDAPPARATDFMTVSNSIDRVLAYYREHAHEPNFWGEKPLKLRRVAARGAGQNAAGGGVAEDR